MIGTAAKNVSINTSGETMTEVDTCSKQNYPAMPIPVTPPGIHAIYSTCRKLYPDQANPLQVTAVVKYWLGGPDPLDYISMYSNPGDADNNIPPHWHYVSFGLSDLHGDGRVHDSTGCDTSGFGFELTFRLKREPGETAPPTWPAALMQALARYVFQSDNSLCVGDHIPWHSPLDGSESRIQHMLMAEDPQLHTIHTSLGTITFVQIVGVCAEELKATQHWNGPGVLHLLSSEPLAGGAWLITDMRRGETIFEIDPQLQEQVERGIEVEGSNLSGVTSRCTWELMGTKTTCDNNTSDDNKENVEAPCSQASCRHISQSESEQIKAALKKGLNYSHPILPPIKAQSTDIMSSQADCRHRSWSRKESFDSTVSSEATTEGLRTRSFEAVHVKLNLEAGALLPLALRGRLKHGRHFTFKSVLNDVAVTLVSSSVVGSIADEQSPYAAHGPWLQVLLTDDFIEVLLQDLVVLSEPEEITLPKTFSWEGKGLTITLVPDEL